MRWIRPNQREIRFWGESVIGRGHADIVVEDRTVSAQHARVSYFDLAWHIRDLGSKNGTYVDGQRVDVGPWRRLEAGARVDLGGAPPFRIADVRAPIMHARSEKGQMVLPVDGVLALPSADAPEVLIMQSDRGHVVERDGVESPISDGQEVRAGESLWRVFIGGDGDLFETQPTTPARDLRTTRFVFTESYDAGLVRLAVACDDGDVSISGRSFILVLLQLARARLADRSQGIDESECGWRTRHEIVTGLRISRDKLNLDLHRARRVLQTEGVRAVDALIERRREQGALRIGLADLTIHPAPEPAAEDADSA